MTQEVAFIRKYDRQVKKNEDLVNEQIRFREVLVIDAEGNKLGVLNRNAALQAAYDADLDLVCVAPKAKTPVCKIMDYGKYRFEQQKKQREIKKNSKTVSIKETQLSPTIDVHDKNVKLKRTLKWLDEGDKVKITMRFRGRQMAHIDLGQKIIEDFVAECGDHCTVEKLPKLEGRTLTAVIAPKKK